MGFKAYLASFQVDQNVLVFDVPMEDADFDAVLSRFDDLAQHRAAEWFAKNSIFLARFEKINHVPPTLHHHDVWFVSWTYHINYLTPTLSDRTRGSKRLKYWFCRKVYFWITRIVFWYYPPIYFYTNFWNQNFWKNSWSQKTFDHFENSICKKTFLTIFVNNCVNNATIVRKNIKRKLILRRPIPSGDVFRHGVTSLIFKKSNPSKSSESWVSS